jgi:hypothetical protein
VDIEQALGYSYAHIASHVMTRIERKARKIVKETAQVAFTKISGRSKKRESVGGGDLYQMIHSLESHRERQSSRTVLWPLKLVGH